MKLSDSMLARILVVFSLMAISFVPFDTRAQESMVDPKPVYVGKVKLDQVSEQLYLRGRLICDDQVDVYSTFGGDVIQIPVEIGDRVRAGELIARVKRLDPGLRFEPVLVEAPISGSITQRFVSPGSRITPQTPLVQIISDDTLIFRAELLQIDVRRVKTDITGILTLSNGVEVADINLGRILPDVDSNKRIVYADFFVPNPDGKLLTGAVGSATIQLSSRQSLTVPREAVFEHDRQSSVYKIDGDTARLVPVSVGLDLGQRLVIECPSLAPGDMVVTFGQLSLKEGDRVSIREDLRR